MAALAPTFAPTRGSSHVHDNHPTAHSDPFWQDMPRKPPMPLNVPLPPVISEKIQNPPNTKQGRQTSANQVRRPQCTHMVVTRVYDERICHLCHNVPSLGWLYICRQDYELDLVGIGDPEAHPAPPVGDNDILEIKALASKSLGLSPSVVKGIRSGHYSIEQADMLIKQKHHVLAVIEQETKTTKPKLPQNQATELQPSHSAENVIASLGTTVSPPEQMLRASQHQVGQTPSKAVGGASSGRSTNLHGEQQTCNYQVCHACRPFFKDRLYQSFERVISGREPAVTEDHWQQLPIFNASVVRNIGLRSATSSNPSPQLASGQSFRTDGTDEGTSDWTTTSATISETDSELIDEQDPYPCPGPGSCPLVSRNTGCAYDHSFDNGVRAFKHGSGPEPSLVRMTPENSLSRILRTRGSIPDTPGSMSTASSISLPSPGATPLTPVRPTDESFEDALMMCMKPGKAATICGPYLDVTRGGKTVRLALRGKTSCSSLGSEVGVEGGVALTEEAVGTGIPDILTDDESS
ncbi:hypothetical protein LTR62_000171 [Meristemomyces frigidus]|uniref:Uncharacterized protein n=1 Tax=Meristemomyces frigidus TaxID=1508187 RepID=A0AAN7YK30_9PEZI|nr:hypothetical protein LTR62_000171 [Meristemomyces frigidus]